MTHLDALLTSDFSWGLSSWFVLDEAEAVVGVTGPEVTTLCTHGPEQLVEEDDKHCGEARGGPWLVDLARLDAADDLDKPSLLSRDDSTSFIRLLVSFLPLRRVLITELNRGFSKRLKAAGGEGSVGSGLLGCSRGRRFFAMGLLLCAWAVPLLLLAIGCSWRLATAGLATTILKGELSTMPG